MTRPGSPFSYIPEPGRRGTRLCRPALERISELYRSIGSKRFDPCRTSVCLCTPMGYMYLCLSSGLLKHPVDPVSFTTSSSATAKDSLLRHHLSALLSRTHTSLLLFALVTTCSTFGRTSALDNRSTSLTTKGFIQQHSITSLCLPLGTNSISQPVGLAIEARLTYPANWLSQLNPRPTPTGDVGPSNSLESTP